MPKLNVGERHAGFTSLLWEAVQTQDSSLIAEVIDTAMQSHGYAQDPDSLVELVGLLDEHAQLGILLALSTVQPASVVPLFQEGSAENPWSRLGRLELGMFASPVDGAILACPSVKGSTLSIRRYRALVAMFRRVPLPTRPWRQVIGQQRGEIGEAFGGRLRQDLENIEDRTLTYLRCNEAAPFVVRSVLAWLGMFSAGGACCVGAAAQLEDTWASPHPLVAVAPGPLGHGVRFLQ